MERKASKDDSIGSSTTAQSLSIRAQKKILGTMGANKTVAKLFIDDTSAHLLDTLYRLTRDYFDKNKLNKLNKRRAEKLLKYSIKSAIKFIVLIRNDQLTSHQLIQCSEFRGKLRQVGVTFTSFYEVDYSFDRQYLSGLLRESGHLLTTILTPHLTAKSIGRLEEVFHFYADEDFLQWLFVDNRHVHQADLKMAVDDLHQLLGEGIL